MNYNIGFVFPRGAYLHNITLWAMIGGATLFENISVCVCDTTMEQQHSKISF